MFDILRPVNLLLIPVILIVGLFYGQAHLPSLLQPWSNLLVWAPLAFSCLLFLVVAFLNSSRLLFASAISLAVWTYLSLDFVSAQFTQLALVLVAVNLFAIAFYKERGTYSIIGLFRIALIFAQPGLLVAAYTFERELFDQYTLWPQLAVGDFLISLPALAAYLFCGLFLLVRLFWQSLLIDAYLLVTLLLCGGLLLLPPADPLTLSLWVSLNQLLLVVALFKRTLSMAYIDELTELPGRRALNERMVKLGNHYTAAMLDVDFFKKFNDTHGHDVGDQVLRLVAKKLRAVRGGTAYRYGGEEFCILFPSLGMEEALEALEEVRQSVEDARLRIRSKQRKKDNRKGRALRGNGGKGQEVSVTISIGAAYASGKSNPLKAADKALYKAKKAGRNQVCY